MYYWDHEFESTKDAELSESQGILKRLVWEAYLNIKHSTEDLDIEDPKEELWQQQPPNPFFRKVQVLSLLSLADW